jgi:hypothetical protein
VNAALQARRKRLSQSLNGVVLLNRVSTSEVNDAKPNPLLFKEGSLRLNKKIPFLSGADRVVSNYKQK